MKCTSHKLLELGIIDGIIEEEQQASLENVDIIAEEIKKEIPMSKEIEYIISFIQSSERGIIR